ncbi:hypothetical protein PIB30_101635 [Stylosanthes scabra]|uniref:Uncharacterized protein n=1 Tax=Stylosanthes scabra TaxID=79078 RepID=A0ABU6SZX1_9FABA|nr:hypothetical protein [Stylosanthes scabra]
MGTGVFYYEYEKREKFEDYDLKANVELGTFKIRRYHFDDESFVHSLHSVRFDPDRPFEVPIEALMADQPLSSSDKERTSARGSHRSRRSSPTPHYLPSMSSSTHRVVSPSPTVMSSSLCRGVAGKTLRPPKSWELISSFEASEKEEEEEDPEEKEEEEEDPEEEVHTSISLPMEIDAIEDYLQFIEELECYPKNSPIHSGQDSVPNLPEDSSDRRSVSHGAPSFDLSGVWPPPSSDLSL